MNRQKCTFYMKRYKGYFNQSNIKPCLYSGVNGEELEPDWVDAPCGGVYRPSANIPPTSYTPILFTPKTGDILQLSYILHSYYIHS